MIAKRLEITEMIKLTKMRRTKKTTKAMKMTVCVQSMKRTCS